MRSVFLASILVVLSAGSALAQGGEKAQDNRPAGTYGSGVITGDMLQSGVQRLVSERFGIAVNYTLPAGWELVEEGKDPATGKLRTDSNVYVLLSRRPMPNKTDATDCIFELDIYNHNLLEGLPKGATESQTSEMLMKNLWTFLNGQLTVYNKGGLKTLTNRKDIMLKAYGPTEGTRPKTLFVPIAYEVPPIKGQKGSTGAKLFTFTSITDGKIWMMKFLVSNDQLENYNALIAMTVNNAFALTSEDYKKLQDNTAKVNERARKAQEQQKKSTKPKGK